MSFDLTGVEWYIIHTFIKQTKKMLSACFILGVLLVRVVR